MITKKEAEVLASSTSVNYKTKNFLFKEYDCTTVQNE